MWWKSGQNSWKSAKSAEICENLGKTPENLGKHSENTAKMASNVLWFKKIAPPSVCWITWKPFLFQKRSSWENIRTKSGPKFFLASLRKSGQKSLAPPKKFACSYSYGRYDPHIAQEAGLFLWCNVMMILQFTHVRFLVCRGRLRNLRVDSCSS